MAPLILGFLLGPLLEQSLHQSLNMGGLIIFLSRPIAVGLFLLTATVLFISLRFLKRLPKAVLEDDSGR